MIEWFPSQGEISSSDGEFSNVTSSTTVDVLSDAEIVDAFPSKIFEDISEVRQILTISTSMQALKTAKNDVVPVIPFLKEYCYDNDNTRLYQRVVFYNLIQDRTLLYDRFDRLYDRAGIRLPRTGFEDIDWSALERKMTKDPRLTHRYFRSKTNKTDGLNRKGNVDNRQSFVYRNHHLVKTHLTNGVRTTHVYDLYIIFNVPILIYRQTSGYPNAEGSFYANMRRFFEAYLLDSTGGYTIYAVVPGTTYLTISLQKTCYSIVRVTERVFSELQKVYTILDAFDSNHIFRPKSQAELDQITQVNCIKRKRGRPAKSLDKIYWYKESCPTTSTAAPSPPPTQSYYFFVGENSNNTSTTPAPPVEHLNIKVEPIDFDEEVETKKSRQQDPSTTENNEEIEEAIRKCSTVVKSEVDVYLDNFFEREIKWVVSKNDEPSMPVLCGDP